MDKQLEPEDVATMLGMEIIAFRLKYQTDAAFHAAIHVVIHLDDELRAEKRARRRESW